MPLKVERKLYSVRRNFLCEIQTNKKKAHLVKRQMVIKGKKDVGLGIRNLKMHNKSLPFKWIWYSKESDDLDNKSTYESSFFGLASS